LNKLSGKFIVLDGPDGCGKSTQSKLLSEWIKAQGITVAGFRDPGTTHIGEKIRDILLDTAHEKMTVNTEMLLYMAARAQLWAEQIAPALEKGDCVIMDRWISSTCAYQGYAGMLGVENVLKVAQYSLKRIWPDLTIILDVDTDTAEKRMDRQLDRMEQKGKEFHTKVREGFLKLADFGQDVIIIDAVQSIEEVHNLITKAVKEIA
jgi:dTMP kinase